MSVVDSNSARASTGCNSACRTFGRMVVKRCNWAFVDPAPQKRKTMSGRDLAKRSAAKAKYSRPCFVPILPEYITKVASIGRPRERRNFVGPSTGKIASISTQLRNSITRDGGTPLRSKVLAMLVEIEET